MDFILFSDGTLSVDGYVAPCNKWHAVGGNLRMTWMWGNVCGRPHHDFFIQIHDNLWAHKEEEMKDNRVMVRLRMAFLECSGWWNGLPGVQRCTPRPAGVGVGNEGSVVHTSLQIRGMKKTNSMAAALVWTLALSAPITRPCQ